MAKLSLFERRRRRVRSALKARSPERYPVLVEELRAAWVARMRTLLQKIDGTTVLLWLKNDNQTVQPRDGLGVEPLFVDGAMVEAIREHATDLLIVAPSAAAMSEGTAGMKFSSLDQAAAAEMAGPRAHQELAAALDPVLRALL